MDNKIKVGGVIHISPPNLTNKHNEQDWKRTSMIILDGDLCEYYSWFLLKRYSIKLAKPLRKAHVTFINDKIDDFNIEEPDKQLELIKNKYDGTPTELWLDLDAKTNGFYWWLNVTPESRELLQNIRNEVGLGKPYFGMHMTIGRASNEKDLEFNHYIHKTILFNK